jgi:hypothetical protein
MCGTTPRVHADDGTGKALCGQPRLDFVFVAQQFLTFAANKQQMADRILQSAGGINRYRRYYRCKQCEKKLQAQM